MRNIIKLTAIATALSVVAAPIMAEARPAKRVVKVCRKSSGTAGLIAGGAGGAVLGHALGGGALGIAAGAVGGAFGGRAIDRSLTAKKRCHFEEVRRR
ncbi:hypothetical protein EOE18_00210 [Novosphingobium umbonatum]|uniref:17 kDa surface antigen n=1 Tax=Novosphingobium umbonatum TaxID=1908524 RepID=A0A3S2UUS9_9SPHN|nr:hypothetical protein [Novosphingobium umbonatum]RVU07556.1 hypothetical protein EOE18_00210 [Novosphingobium umbonatum]